MGKENKQEKEKRPQINVRLSKMTQDMFEEIKILTGWGVSQIVIKGMELTLQWAREERKKHEVFKREK